MRREYIWSVVLALLTALLTFAFCLVMDKYDAWPKEPLIRLAPREVIIVKGELR